MMPISFEGRLEPIGDDATLLVVDDDDVFRSALVRAMAKRSFVPVEASSISDALFAVDNAPPAYAVIDLRLQDGSGIEVVEALRIARPESRVVVLTGYGAIPHVVAAVKAGAIDCLTKPSNADDIENALRASKGMKPPPPEQAADVREVHWEHIVAVYEQCGRNVTATAGSLNMHRRTLQRMFKARNFRRGID